MHPKGTDTRYIVLSFTEGICSPSKNEEYSFFNTVTDNLATPVKLYVRSTKEMKIYVLLMK